MTNKTCAACDGPLLPKTLNKNGHRLHWKQCKACSTTTLYRYTDADGEFHTGKTAVALFAINSNS